MGFGQLGGLCGVVGLGWTVIEGRRLGRDEIKSRSSHVIHKLRLGSLISLIMGCIEAKCGLREDELEGS
jgi:hypothetical protein